MTINKKLLTIGDIYAGKPDANDEIKEQGYDEFVNSYIEPTGIDIEEIAITKYGSPYFVMGDKGTGKTALLHFLENYVRTLDDAACSSFVFFESGYSQVDRAKLNTISQAISTPIAVDASIAASGKELECDFTYIWRWQFYQKIIDDNKSFNSNLFIDDDDWTKFCHEISKIDKTIYSGKMRIPAKITFSATTNPQFGTVEPSIGVEPLDLSKPHFNNTASYGDFIKIIQKADDLILNVTRTDIPYYIFIDELEAYRSGSDVFYRDLRMIRDLLFTTKRMNDTFRERTKFVCSVRLEIVNSINRFVQSNQLHKIMQGYDKRLTWEYTNTNSFKHPIISILIRRIEMAEEKAGIVNSTQHDLIKRWFVSQVYNTHICTYILDNTWHRPRDIVRLILAAQSKNSKRFYSFNQNAFETFMHVYSKQCLVEVQEEMRALYTAEEIDCIVQCFRGYKTIFSYDEINERVGKLFPNTFLTEKLVTVLNDLYRIGFIGNYLNKDTATQWEYKEKYSLLIDSPWKMIIHPSLNVELSISGRKDKHFNIYASGNVTLENSQPLCQADISLKCIECSGTFIFSAGEQEFYAQQNFRAPKRCINCRTARKNATRASREYFSVKCSSCGVDAKVPFEPKEGHPVYCWECLNNNH
ncbi:P-loop ATPase, Sll1717 family [Konateibacter massiliensis]|uniref:P-loop ATPase, Sll1717 family n=1 Tax=Konateibacter massiliensis TaxID=2002841 RepID=UPI002E2746AD